VAVALRGQRVARAVVQHREAHQVAVALRGQDGHVRLGQQALVGRHAAMRQHVARDRRPDALGGIGVEVDLGGQHGQAQGVIGDGGTVGDRRVVHRRHCRDGFRKASTRAHRGCA